LKGAAPQVDWYGVQDPLATDIQAIYSDLAKQGSVQESGKRKACCSVLTNGDTMY
jgi:hypothetical protein